MSRRRHPTERGNQNVLVYTEAENELRTAPDKYADRAAPNERRILATGDGIYYDTYCSRAPPNRLEKKQTTGSTESLPVTRGPPPRVLPHRHACVRNIEGTFIRKPNCGVIRSSPAVLNGNDRGQYAGGLNPQNVALSEKKKEPLNGE